MNCSHSSFIDLKYSSGTFHGTTYTVRWEYETECDVVPPSSSPHCSPLRLFKCLSFASTLTKLWHWGFKLRPLPSELIRVGQPSGNSVLPHTGDGHLHDGARRLLVPRRHGLSRAASPAGLTMGQPGCPRRTMKLPLCQDPLEGGQPSRHPALLTGLTFFLFFWTLA